MTTVEAHGIDAVIAFLEHEGVRHEVVEHRPTFSAAAEARASGAELREAAKTLALHDHDGYRMAVIPATHRLDVHRARELLGASSHLRLATEAELERDFPMFDVGAMPPLGPMMPMPEIIDVHLLYHDHVLCAGGDHRHSLRLDPRDLLRVCEPRVAAICETPEGRSRFRDLPRI
ncbi:MAG TPA: YbaK/EbsC family protein [Solirubrobacteraceae bacterium]|nr:YbaK/EbsC family protein [Solirubrobacteraceae bacterium]